MTLDRGWSGPPKIPRKHLDRESRLVVLAVHGTGRSGTPWMLALRRELLALGIAGLDSQRRRVEDRRYLLAQELVASGDYAEALSELDALTELATLPGVGDVDLLRARALMGLGDLEAARGVLGMTREMMRAVGYRKDEAGVLLAELEERAGDFAAARRWAATVLGSLAGLEEVFPALRERAAQVLERCGGRRSG
ncbi:MAG: hypothetical protein EPO52_01215 [Herbiconiux sp.]|uniref:tetratricopeptide repeat protein n=1 Tax=Herbiconiux sp. TaxID=1871186 RepID=UPI0012259FDE|nr:tetratricopeptide repeat protein [Herbiconiux sp.]TAJ50087.1 MAG: hypothetical protein EPO52_01215 [Herbiconiux sp.]